MKRFICIILATMMSFAGIVCAETPAPGKSLTALEAMGIDSRSEIKSGYMVSLEKCEAMNLSETQIDTFFSAAQNIILTRRLVKNPFNGICIVLQTSAGDKAYYLNSGVQLGTFGSDNYLCYSTAEENDLLDSLYVNFMSSGNKYPKDGITINTTDYFVFPNDQWAVNDAIFGASHSLLPYDVAECFGLALSRERFCILLGNFIAVYGNYADLSGYLSDKDMAYLTNYFDDTAGCDESINMLHALGIVNGVENNLFTPGNTLSREQAAVMIKKTADLLGIKGTTVKGKKYSDGHLISAWAKDSVDFVVANGIMSETDGQFYPMEYLTTEQAVAAINKFYKLAKK